MKIQEFHFRSAETMHFDALEMSLLLFLTLPRTDH